VGRSPTYGILVCIYVHILVSWPDDDPRLKSKLVAKCVLVVIENVIDIMTVAPTGMFHIECQLNLCPL
jgi:hypothetical protein